MSDFDAATALKIADRLPRGSGRTRRADGARNALASVVLPEQTHGEPNKDDQWRHNLEMVLAGLQGLTRQR